MTREEAINVLNDYDINFERNTAEEIAEAHEMAIKALQEQQHYKDLAESYEKTINKLTKAIAEQQPSEDEKIIKIKKGTLKVRTGRYVIYDVEWLKTHFNTTEAKIYGQPQPNERTETHECDCVSRKGYWITQWNVTHQKEYYYCSECREEFSYDGETGIKMNDYSYCPNCGSCNRGRKE